MNLDTFWSLPSPKRWLDDVVNKINEEHLCVVQVPAFQIESFGFLCSLSIIVLIERILKVWWTVYQVS